MTRTGGDPDETTISDLSPWFDPAAGTIRSATSELLWDYRREICTMDAPAAQGVTGFLRRGGGRYELSDVTIESENEYATVNVVSLDDRPIAESQRILVQVVTVNRLTGYETKPASFTIGKGERAYSVEGEQIVRIGKPPFRIANTNVTLAIDNPRLSEAVVLDIHGYKKLTVPIENGRLTLPEDAIYVVLRPTD